MATDTLSTYETSPDAPARNGAAVTTSDTTDLTTVSRALYVGGTGDVSVNFVGAGAAIVFKAVPAGTVLPVQASRVLATGTTATSIVALW